MNRCLTDYFAYCTSQPKRDTKKVPTTYIDFGGKLVTIHQLETCCSLDPSTCGSYLTQTQLHLQLTT